MRLPMHDQQLLDAIWAAIHREIDRRLAPITTGGKLNLSSPNVVGHLPAAHGGTGGTSGGSGTFAEGLYFGGAALTFGGDGLYFGGA